MVYWGWNLHLTILIALPSPVLVCQKWSSQTLDIPGSAWVFPSAFSTGRDPQGVAYRALRSGLDIRSVIVMSGAVDGEAPYASTSTRSSLLVIQSARDQCNAPFYGLQIYRDVHQNNKWFLELLRAHHLPPFDGEDIVAFPVVARVTTSFLEFSLDDALPSSMTAEGNARPMITRMFHAGRGPYIAPYVDPPACGPH